MIRVKLLPEGPYKNWMGEIVSSQGNGTFRVKAWASPDWHKDHDLPKHRQVVMLSMYPEEVEPC